MNEHLDNHGAALPLDLIDKFLDVQKEEIEQRSKETYLAEKNEEHQFNYAMFVTELQSKDNDKNREVKMAMFKMSLSYGIGFAALLTILTGIAFYFNKEHFILEIAKIIFYSLGGALVGNYYQKSKRSNNYQAPIDEN